MIASLRPYPEYKDSGVSWAEKIPQHWDLLPLRRIGQIQLSNVDKHTTTGEVPVRLCNYTDVYRRRFITSDIEFMKASALSREVQKFQLRRGDVLITKDSESWTDIAVPAYVTADMPGVLCGYHLAHIRPNHELLSGEYLMRAFEAEPLAGQFRTAATGVTRFALSGDDIAGALFLVPPRSEQDVIAAFLAAIDRRIGRVIRAKRRLIELLNEQKQAIIHRAVTRGLDPTVRLKRTLSSWFPSVPVKWCVLSLRRLVSRVVDGPHHSPVYVGSGIPFISARNIRDDRWNLADSKFISKEDYARFSERVVPEPGDVLYTKGGTTGIARAVDLSFPFQVWVHVAVLKLKRSIIDPEFLSMALNSPLCYEQSQLYTRGATNQDLGLNRMKDIVLPVPPTVEEQRAITVRVTAELTSLRQAVASVAEEIDRLREYRMRLVSDIVTGKLDVRDAGVQGWDQEDVVHDLYTEEEQEDALSDADEAGHADE